MSNLTLSEIQEERTELLLRVALDENYTVEMADAYSSHLDDLQSDLLYESEALQAMRDQLDPPTIADFIHPHHNKNAVFVAEMFDMLAWEEAAPVVCGFPGDPNSSTDARWWCNSGRLGESPRVFESDKLNAYLAVSSFTKGEFTNKKTGKKFMSWARKKSTFVALHFIMLDDLGTGQGAKVSMDKLVLEPTALIETSPDNYQAFLKLSEPLADRAKAEKLIKALIQQGLLSKTDPGMAGVTRYGRLPVGINGKPKYGGWDVKMEVWEPARVHTVDEIIEAFGLDLSKVGGDSQREIHAGLREQAGIKLPTMSMDDDPIYAALSDKGVFNWEASTRDKGDDGVYIDMECPWIDEHTDKANTGTAYRIGGGFSCHHGHCDGRGIRAVLEKLDMPDALVTLDKMQSDQKLIETQLTNEAIVALSPFITQGAKH